MFTCRPSLNSRLALQGEPHTQQKESYEMVANYWETIPSDDSTDDERDILAFIFDPSTPHWVFGADEGTQIPRQSYRELVRSNWLAS